MGRGRTPFQILPGVHILKRHASTLISAAAAFVAITLLAVPGVFAQDLGPAVRKVKDGIYVYAQKAADSNCGIIVTGDGVLLVDSGHFPADSQAVAAIVRKLTTQPVRFVMNTEPHDDHTTGHYVFSPPATIVAAAGTGEAMRKAGYEARNLKQMAENPKMADEFRGYRMVTPQVEYQQKMVLNVGGRTVELIQLKNVHSEADTAIWLPKERVLFATAAVGVKRFPNIRPFLNLADILASIRQLRALNPEVVIAGHGEPGTTQIFDEMERYYALLVERVGGMAREGKTLDQIKAEIRMPEVDDWAAKERFPNNVEAAYRMVTAAK
jgi:cyclase